MEHRILLPAFILFWLSHIQNLEAKVELVFPSAPSTGIKQRSILTEDSLQFVRVRRDRGLLSSPDCLKLPLNVPNRTLASGGPGSPALSTLMASKSNPIGISDKVTSAIMGDIREGLKYAFQTKNEWTFPLTATGHSAMEAILCNLLEPGDIILVPNCGSWGGVISEMSRRLGAIVINIEKPYGEAFSVAELEDAISTHKPQVVFLVHGESTTGVIQQIEGVGQICRKHNCLLIVDVVATIGIVPFFFDKWQIDAAYSNSQKGLGSTVGMAPITLGPRALKKIQDRKSPVKSYLYDMNILMAKNYWNVDPTRPCIPHHSLSLNLMYALREGLALLANEGLENAWKRHAEATSQLTLAMEQLGMQHYVPNPSNRLVGTITYKPLKNITPAKLAVLIRESHGIEIGIGAGTTAGTLIRFGIFGHVAHPNVVKNIIHAFQEVVSRFN